MWNELSPIMTRAFFTPISWSWWLRTSLGSKPGSTKSLANRSFLQGMIWRNRWLASEFRGQNLIKYSARSPRSFLFLPSTVLEEKFLVCLDDRWKNYSLWYTLLETNKQVSVIAVRGTEPLSGSSGFWLIPVDLNVAPSIISSTIIMNTLSANLSSLPEIRSLS